MKKVIRLLPAALLLFAGAALPLSAQHPSEFNARDKTEIFIQHMVKFMKVEPAAYQAMVLEFEIGAALAELSSVDIHRTSNFIHRALEELNPQYRRAHELIEAGKDAEALAALKDLIRHQDPYIAAHARLLRVELDFRAGRHDQVIELCERINLKDRLYLVQGYRACELIALSFEKLQKPLLEFAQYAILLIDYEDLPKELEKRARSRLLALNDRVGNPLHKVAGWMNQVEKLLAREFTSEEPTQAKERQIVTALDKLIELQEARERNTCSGCGGTGCKGGCKNGNPNARKSFSPARVSRLPRGGEGDLNLRGVSRANADTRWGDLREKKASRTLQSFSGKLPPRYEKLLEQYFKEVARDN